MRPNLNINNPRLKRNQLRHCFSKKPTRCFDLHEFVKAVTLVLCTSLCIWQCSVTLQEYLSFNVKTTVKYETMDDLDFPAMSFAMLNPLRRTVVGGSDLLKIVAANALAHTKEEVLSYINLLNRSCFYEVDTTNYVINKLHSLNVADFTKLPFAGIVSGLEFAVVNAKMTFMKCWWNQKEIDCHKSILTTFTDIGVALSLNIDPGLAQNFLKKDTGLNVVNGDYNNTNVKKTQNLLAGIGFSFLINANRQEYCSYEYQYIGAGFWVQFHEPRALPSFKTIPSIYLTPGYKFEVNLKPIHYNRHTEHLGKCLASYHSYVTPDSTLYVKQLCVYECLYELMYSTCKCLPQALPSVKIGIAKKFNVKESDGPIPLCSAALTDPCNVAVYDNYMRTEYNLLCPSCKQPCIETKYDYQITAVRFPTENFVKFYNAVDFETLKRNYFLMTIQIENSNVVIVDESQHFTLNDLFIYIGSSLTLFVGMSFTSLIELIFKLILIVHRKYVTKICANKPSVVISKPPKINQPPKPNRVINNRRLFFKRSSFRVKHIIETYAH